MSALGSLVVKLALEYAEYTQGLDKSDQAALSFAKRAQEHFDRAGQAGSEFFDGIAKRAVGAAAALVSVGATIEAVNRSLNDLAALDDLAQKTGASVESLSRLQQVAGTFDHDFGAVDAALVKLSRGLAGADDDSNKTMKALKALGVSAKDANGNLRDAGDILIDVSKAQQTYQDGAGKAALMTDALGKSGAELLPYMNDVADSVDKFTGRTAEAAAQAATFQDQINTARHGMQELVTDVTVAALPALNDLLGALVDAGKASDDLATSDVGSWADDLAVGLARVVDVARLLPKMMSAVSGSFKTAGADVQYVSRMLALTNPMNIVKAQAEGSSLTKEIAKAAAERNRVLAEANKQWSDLWNKPANELEQDVLKRIAERHNAAEKPQATEKPKPTLKYGGGDDADAKKELDAYTALISAIKAKVAENELELASDDALSESQKARIKLDQDIANGRLKLAPAHLAAVHAALDEQAATEDLLATKRAQKDVDDALAQSARSRAASTDSLRAEYLLYGQSAEAREIAMVAIKAEAELEKALADMRLKGLPISAEMEAQLRAERDMRVEVEQATLAQTKALGYAGQLAEQNKRYAAEAILDETKRAAAIVEIDAQMWRDRIALAGDGTEAQRLLQEEYNTWYANQLAKPQLDAQRKFWESIDSTAHDTFVSIMDGSKDAATRIKDTFKNVLFDWLYQMTAKQWIVNLSASTSGGGAGGAAGMAQSAGSSALMSTVGSALGITGAMSAFGGTLATGFMNTIAGTGMSAGLTAGSAMLANGSIASGLGMIAGSLGPIAIGVGAILAISKKLDDSGTYHTGGAASASAEGVKTIKAESLNFERTRVAEDTNTFTSQIAASVVSILDSTASAFGKAAGYTAATAFADDSSKDGAWGGLVISNKAGKVVDWQDTRTSRWAPKEFADGEAGQKEYLKALSVSVRDALDGIGLPSWAGKMLDSLGDAPALEDLAKVVDEINATQAALGVLRQNLVGFANLSDSAADAMIKASGGMAALSSNASAYYEAFYDEGEKTAAATRQIKDALKDVGLQMPSTRAGFRALVESQMALGEKGASTVAVLLQVAGAFAAITPAGQAAAEELDSVAAANADALMAAVNTAFDALTRSVDAQKNVVTKAYDDAMSALQGRIDSVTQSISKLTSLSSALHGYLDNLSIPDQAAQTRAAAQAQVATALAIARAGGPLPSSESLQKALQTLSQDASGQFSSYLDFQRDMYRTANDIGALAGITDGQLSVQEQQLAVLEDQSARAQKQHEDEMARLDKIVEDAQSSIDVLNGINTTLLTVPQALALLSTVMGQAAAAPAIREQSSAAQIEGLYNSILGRASDAQGKAFWQASLNAGMSVDYVRAQMLASDEYKAKTRAVPGFETGGDHVGGLRIVGEKGPELEATGPARIFNASQTARILGGGSGELAAKVEGLAAAVGRQGELLAAIATNTGNTATSSDRSAKVLQRATQGKDYLMVKEVAG